MKKLISFLLVSVLFIGGHGLQNINAIAASPISLSISSESTIVNTGDFVSFDAKYTINDYSSIKENDFILLELPESLSNSSVSYSKLHFKELVKQSDNIYKLVFNGNADIALKGYLSIGAISTNNTSSSIDVTTKVSFKTSSAESKVKILPSRAYSPTKENRTIVKFTEQTGTGYRQISAMKGIMYNDCTEINYLIEVNARMGNLSNTIVEDFIPNEAELDVKSIKFMKYNSSENNYNQVDKNNFSIETSKHHLKVDFGNLGTNRYRMSYTAKVKNNQIKIINKAIINYSENLSEQITEMQEFTVAPFDNAGAANGYKKVDKQSIEYNDEDQTVTYTIVLENDNAFEVGAISLVDKLNPAVKFIQAIASDDFDVIYNKDSHSVSIKNINTLTSNRRREVKIITDFSNVTPGAIIKNTVGSNTVSTQKTMPIKGSVKLTKTGDDTNGAGLANAQFSLYRQNGSEPVATDTLVNDNLTTNSVGEIIVSDLPFGKYYFAETTAPNGYKISTEKVVFELSSAMLNATVSMENKRNSIPWTPLEPSTPIVTPPVVNPPVEVITDEGTPLTPPVEETIDDNKTPLDSGTDIVKPTKAPQTSDSTPNVLWFIVLVAFSATLLLKKKFTKENKINI